MQSAARDRTMVSKDPAVASSKACVASFPCGRSTLRRRGLEVKIRSAVLTSPNLEIS